MCVPSAAWPKLSFKYVPSTKPWIASSDLKIIHPFSQFTISSFFLWQTTMKSFFVMITIFSSLPYIYCPLMRCDWFSTINKLEKEIAVTLRSKQQNYRKRKTFMLKWSDNIVYKVSMVCHCAIHTFILNQFQQNLENGIFWHFNFTGECWKRKYKLRGTIHLTFLHE